MHRIMRLDYPMNKDELVTQFDRLVQISVAILAFFVLTQLGRVAERIEMEESNREEPVVALVSDQLDPYLYSIEPTP